MGSIGIKIQNDLPPVANVELARYVEAAGLGSVWASEYRWEAVVPLTSYALGTERVKVGSAILPIYTRSAPVLAMTAANLAQLAPDRLILGLGTSTKQIIERWHGRVRARPLRAAREYIEAVRLILAGDRVHFEGEVVSVDGFQLDGEVQGKVEIYAAALGEKMLRVAGEVADGALLNLTPFHHLPKIQAVVDEASAAAGRAPGSVRLGGDVRIAIAEGEEAEAIREQQRREISTYAKMPPYNRFFAEAGFPEQAAAVMSAWERGDRDAAVAAVDDEMLDSIIVVGDLDHVRSTLGRMLAAGYEHLIAFPLWQKGADPAAVTRGIADAIADVGAEEKQASIEQGAV